MAQLQLIVVTPETTVLDEPVEFVALPLYDGEIGILPGRAPLIGRLGYGELRFNSATGSHRYYVDGGFVQVADNVVSVLTNRAVPAEAIDRGLAEQNLQQARAKKANNDELLEIRDRQEQQARAQLRVASHSHAH